MALFSFIFCIIFILLIKEQPPPPPLITVVYDRPRLITGSDCIYPSYFPDFSILTQLFNFTTVICHNFNVFVPDPLKSTGAVDNKIISNLPLCNTHIIPLAASTTDTLESWPTHTKRSPLPEKLTLCTQPPENNDIYKYVDYYIWQGICNVRRILLTNQDYIYIEYFCFNLKINQ